MSIQEVISHYKHLPGKHQQKWHGGGKAASGISNANYTKSLGAETKSALKHYTGSGYKSINKSLRSGKDFNYPKDAETAKRIDAAIANSPPIKPRTLWRAMGMSPDELGLKPGAVYQIMVSFRQLVQRPICTNCRI